MNTKLSKVFGSPGWLLRPLHYGHGQKSIEVPSAHQHNFSYNGVCYDQQPVRSGSYSRKRANTPKCMHNYVEYPSVWVNSRDN